MSHSTNLWASDRAMNYAPWAYPIVKATSNRPVVLNQNGSWSLETTIPEGSSVLCNLGRKLEKQYGSFFMHWLLDSFILDTKNMELQQ